MLDVLKNPGLYTN